MLHSLVDSAALLLKCNAMELQHDRETIGDTFPYTPSPRTPKPWWPFGLMAAIVE